MYPDQKPGEFSWFMWNTSKVFDLKVEQNSTYEFMISIHDHTTQLQFFWFHYMEQLTR